MVHQRVSKLTETVCKALCMHVNIICSIGGYVTASDNDNILSGYHPLIFTDD